MTNEPILPQWLTDNLPELETDDHREDMQDLEQAYLVGIQNILAWRDNKDDFVASYRMLDTHPTFWVRNTPEKTLEWKTIGHVQGFWHALSRTGMVMECGSHVPDTYGYHYHNLRLDTYGTSYEDCIVKTAALVDRFFHEDGIEREDVEYEKSQLELDLESSVECSREQYPDLGK